MIKVTDHPGAPVNQGIGYRLVRHAKCCTQRGTPVKYRPGLVCRGRILIQVEGRSINADDPVSALLFHFADGIVQMRGERAHDRVDAIFEKYLEHSDNALAGLIFLDEIIFCEAGV